MEYKSTDQKSIQTKDTIIKIFAVVGLVVILVAALWLGIKAFQRVPDALSGVGGAFSNLNIKRETISVEAAPSTVNSGEELSISFTHEDKKSDGSYTFSYNCKDGLVLTTNEGETVFCNVPFHFMNEDNTLSFSVSSDVLPTLESQVTIEFTENNRSRPSKSGHADITVLNTDLIEIEEEDQSDDSDFIGPDTNPAVSTETLTQTGEQTVEITGTPTAPYVPFSDPNGTPDLAITILGLGSVDRNGNFTEKGLFDRDDDRSAIKFEVKNIGTKETGKWEFEAKLPTIPREYYNAREQDSLFPGERIEFVLGFDNVRSGPTETISIDLDPDDDIDELSETNNSADVEIEIEN